MNKIILASSSPYRRSLLARTGLAFNTFAPDLPEEEISSRLLSEKKTPKEIAEQVAVAKAEVAAQKFPGALIIAGDQLVSFKGKILGKPHTHQAALLQLQDLRGQTHELITALILLGPERLETHTEVTRLKMKMLSDQELENYVSLDMPLDCAGSYKIEKSGIVLFESVESADFSAIQGMPMIWLSNRLKEYGYEFFNPTTD